MKTALSVIVPVFNESQNLDELVERLTASVSQITADYEFIFVNDSSTDNSLEKLLAFSSQDKRIKYLSFSRNFGHQVAVMAGLDHCQGDAVVLIDGDLQDPPELIPVMYAKYRTGFDCVYARRSARKGESFFKKVTAKIFYRIMRRITDVDIPIDTGDFRLIDRKIVDILKLMPEQNKFLRGQIAWMGFRQTFVEYKRDERKAGVSGYSLRKMIRLAIDGITAFSDFPLRFVTNVGIFISGFAFLVILYAIYSHFILDHTITGWTSLIISTMFIGGIQLISVGIIGEYIKRINKDVRNRPLYIVEQKSFEESRDPRTS